MLSFLLDEHLSPDIAAMLSRLRPEIAVETILLWDQGMWSGESDESILRAASSRGLTLVTYDQRTIPPILRIWAERGESHAGVILVDERTISPANFPVLARSLIQFWDLHNQLDWKDRIAFLSRAQ